MEPSDGQLFLVSAGAAAPTIYGIYLLERAREYNRKAASAVQKIITAASTAFPARTLQQIYSTLSQLADTALSDIGTVAQTIVNAAETAGKDLASYLQHIGF